MKFVIISSTFLLFLLSELFCSSVSADCFNVDKWEKDSKRLGADITENFLNLLCTLLNFGNQEYTNKCKQILLGQSLPIWYPLYRSDISKYALNDDAKKTIKRLADDCRNAKDNKNFFPCLLDEFRNHCPEITDFYKAAIEKLGYKYNV
uniref:Saposin B-type domain-containing protein n=1 Tax=Strigamia maritima TaxID=126957 RepID=T1II57_STRMM